MIDQSAAAQLLRATAYQLQLDNDRLQSEVNHLSRQVTLLQAISGADGGYVILLYDPESDEERAAICEANASLKQGHVVVEVGGGCVTSVHGLKKGQRWSVLDWDNVGVGG